MAETTYPHQVGTLKDSSIPPVQVIATNTPITSKQVNELFSSGCSNTILLIRSETGDVHRGGFFFNLQKTPNAQYTLYTSLDGDQASATPLDLSTLTRLINHIVGLRFDAEMLRYCQNVINHRVD